MDMREYRHYIGLSITQGAGELHLSGQLERHPTMLKILYFARLREAFGAAHEKVALPAGVINVAGLLAFLRARGGNWEKELAPQRNFRVAVNQDMADPETAISAGDEIALFPPVTGG